MHAQLLSALGAFILSLLLAPLLSGVINRVKAIMGGRRGKPLLQLYYDLHKLLHKRPVYSYCTTWFFRAAPAAGVCGGFFVLLILPFGAVESLVSFPGDFVLPAGLFALSRFALMLSALDTGSAFEGMGAAREAFFSALAEPIFLFCLLTLGYRAGAYSLTDMLGVITPEAWLRDWPFFLMISISLFLLLLPENCRIPVDDPNTHLELTMIHEVMILDHSGPDLAFLEYASALKLWIFCLLIAGVAVPAPSGTLFLPDGSLGSGGLGMLAASGLCTLAAVFALAMLVGLVESLMARFRMERVPQILTLSGSFVCLAALSLWR